MYIPSEFTENQAAEIHRIINNSPLGTMVFCSGHGLQATHLPFLCTPKLGLPHILRAHIARANPLWQNIKPQSEVMIIFQAENAYISPNWYPSKHEFHRQVPTWNYQVVHIHGTLTICHDRKFLLRVLTRLTKQNETRVGEAHPWKLSQSNKDYLEALLGGIVGIEIKVKHIEAASKLSQNKDDRDRAGAILELLQRGDRAVAIAMKNARTKPFD